MKHLLILIITSSLILSCDNERKEVEDEGQLIEADRDDKTEFNELRREGDYYTFTGEAPERKSAFEKAAISLEENVNKLKNSTTNNDVQDKLSEVNEKIQEAREKAAKADEKIAANNYEDANEVIEDAREKLEEAREKYNEVLNRINNVE